MFIGFVLIEIKNYFIKKEKPSINKMLVMIGKKIFVVTLVFWFMLEANTLLNNWNEAKKDFKLIGKSLDEKRTIVNTADFYPFILF